MKPSSVYDMKLDLLLKLFLFLIGTMEHFGQARNLNLDTTAPDFRLNFPNFEPKIKVVFETNLSALPVLQFQSKADLVEAAKRFMETNSRGLHITMRETGSHTTSHNGITHVYLKQVVNSIDVCNGVANLVVNSDGGIVSVGNSFYRGDIPKAKARFKKDPVDAIMSLAKHIGMKQDRKKLVVVMPTTKIPPNNPCKVTGSSFATHPIKAKLEYVQMDGRLSHCWAIEARMKNNRYHAHVDTTTGKLITLIDWVHAASYNVLPFGTNDPDSGKRVTVNNPANTQASPLGWHNQGNGKTFTSTIGNNVYAQSNPSGSSEYLNNPRPDGGQALKFDFPLDLAKQPSTYIDAATTNLFYWNNIIHDLYYLYGFTETAGNFQENNMGRGAPNGANDAVIAFAQDGKGKNNAFFSTPPDGEHGRMTMFIFKLSDPNRDGDLDDGIIVHEYTHGLSSRLTGGPADVNCLHSGEAVGMGEGWGDFVATILRTNKGTTRNDNFGFASYVHDNSKGSRHYQYSTSLQTNPTTYGYAKKTTESHSLGEIWCSLLFEVYWNLVDKYGYQANWFQVDKMPLLNGGNVMMLQLVIDGMKIQPCRPTMVDARDAILMADVVNNGGVNACQIWKGFAKRGLGANAAAGGNEDFTVPANVC